eukprot:g30777.t1
MDPIVECAWAPSRLLQAEAFDPSFLEAKTGGFPRCSSRWRQQQSEIGCYKLSQAERRLERCLDDLESQLELEAVQQAGLVDEVLAARLEVAALEPQEMEDEEQFAVGFGAAEASEYASPGVDERSPPAASPLRGREQDTSEHRFT